MVLVIGESSIEQLCWKPSWLDVGEIVAHGADNSPLLLLVLRGVEVTLLPRLLASSDGPGQSSQRSIIAAAHHM